MPNIDSPLVSTIICTRNRPELLLRAVESVLAQNYENIEIIIVDDFSQKINKTKTIDYLKKYPELKIQWLPSNKGVAYASNRGFEQSKGKFIALLGDDDYWIQTDKIAKQVAATIKNENVGLVGTYWITDNGREKSLSQPVIGSDIRVRLLSGGGIICGSTALITREAWLSAGGFDERLKRGTDSDLFRRIYLKGFKLELIHENTTYVDAIPDRLRMTPINNLFNARRVLLANIYILKKYSFEFDAQPDARMKRRLTVVIGAWRCYLLSGRKLYKKYARKCMWKALKESVSCIEKIRFFSVILKVKLSSLVRFKAP